MGLRGPDGLETGFQGRGREGAEGVDVDYALHRQGDLVIQVKNARYIAERIQRAQYVELPGPDHFAWVGDTDAILDDVEQFLTGARSVGNMNALPEAVAPSLGPVNVT